VTCISAQSINVLTYLLIYLLTYFEFNVHYHFQTIRPQFAIECLRRSIQQGMGWVKIYGVPLGVAYIRDVGVCRERTPQTN